MAVAVNNVVSGSGIRIISTDGPTPAELAHQKTLECWCDNTVEPEEESERRRAALDMLRSVCKAWIRRVYTDQHNWPADDDVGGRIFTTGSYRYNAHSSGSDIDVVLIAPTKVQLEDFVTSLPPLIRAQPGVSDMIVIPAARVPLITFKVHGIDFDLSFGSICRTRVPDNIDMLNDRILVGLTEKSTKAANAVRVADLLIKSVPNVAVFRHVLRFVKVWAKARGVYSFKIGFPSGIGWAILAAKICQCFPNKNGAGALFSFFSFYHNWFKRNPTPTSPNNAIYLTASHEPAIDLRREGVGASWNPREKLKDSRALFPVLTPAYPYQDACDNVSMTTLGCLCDEFARAHSIVRQLREATAAKAPELQSALHKALAAKLTAEKECTSQGEAAERGKEVMKGVSFGELWETLLEKIPFFTAFPTYIRITISATDPREYRQWVDMMESKVCSLWKEGGHNKGCALETWAAYLQLRPMSVTVEEPGQAALIEKAKKELMMQESSESNNNNNNNNANGGGGGGGDGNAATAAPANRGANNSTTNNGGLKKYSAYFFIGMALLPGAKIADPQNPSAGGIDLKRAISAFIPCAMQSQHTPKSALPPVVEVIPRANLDSWLPGADPKAPLTPIGALADLQPAQPQQPAAAAVAAASAAPLSAATAVTVSVPLQPPPSTAGPGISAAAAAVAAALMHMNRVPGAALLSSVTSSCSASSSAALPLRRDRDAGGGGTDEQNKLEENSAAASATVAATVKPRPKIVPTKKQAEMESLLGFDF